MLPLTGPGSQIKATTKYRLSSISTRLLPRCQGQLEQNRAWVKLGTSEFMVHLVTIPTSEILTPQPADLESCVVLRMRVRGESHVTSCGGAALNQIMKELGSSQRFVMLNRDASKQATACQASMSP